MNRRLPFRAWFYFRTGWGVYFAFIFAAINTLVITYYLAIERYPELNQIFPSFLSYVTIVIGVGIPILVLSGYAHFKKTGAYRAEADLQMEIDPYLRRMLINTEMMIPLQIKILDLLIKLSKNEKLTQDELNEISKIQKELTEHIKPVKKGKLLQFDDTSYQRFKEIDEEKK